MIKAVATINEHQQLLLIGLSFANLDKFRAEAGDTFIKITGTEVGLPVDVLLFSGETEAHMAEQLRHYIGPATVVYVDEKLQS